MGADKAFLEWNGRSLLERGLEVLGSVCSRVAIVGEAAKFSKYCQVVEDAFPGCGPLAGIHAGLTHSPADLNLMLAVDMPFVTPSLLAHLLGVAAEGHALVTVPRTPRGLQPLCAVYRREFAGAAEGALRAGKYKIDALFSGIPVRIVEESELVRAGFSEQSFFNINTPADLRGAGNRT